MVYRSSDRSSTLLPLHEGVFIINLHTKSEGRGVARPSDRDVVMIKVAVQLHIPHYSVNRQKSILISPKSAFSNRHVTNRHLAIQFPLNDRNHTYTN